MRRRYFATAAEEKAAVRLAKLIGAHLGVEIDPHDIHLFSARGYWAQTTQDVQRFTGHHQAGNLYFDVGSWEYTLTDVARGKGRLQDNLGDRNAYSRFEIV